ncbi:MAG: hypothetical protein WC886_03740 [Saccharofermentanaceae bacterium]|jgi:hypothetical protein|nr:hypothetical protein [Clostridia bacterium]NLX68271.1 hypothetical protein [Clostridiaceae bacterium]HOO49174.1 hypothetical protein [Saccharofermentans sp.]HPE27494.1 hypothetical protein [Saccharofermentans sp.]HPG64297.1 hypothetical protein [Saccharofermentans sp.]
MGRIIKDALIEGDLFKGICVDEYDDATYEFCVDGIDVRLHRKLETDTDKKKMVSFLFEPQKQVRFRLDVLIPDDCKNAQVGLNGKELISFFDKSFKVDNEEPFTKGTCEDSKNKYSTLRPGEFQTLNFAWDNQDKVVFAFYY